MGDHDTGSRRNDQRRDLRYEPFTNGEDGIRAYGLRERKTLLHDTDEYSADDVDEGDDQRSDRVSLHELGRAVHRAVEIGLARDLGAAAARFILVDEPRIQISVDRHLLARHRVECESRSDFCNTSGTLCNDDEVDADENQEQHESDGVVAANHELTECLNDVPGLAVRQDQSRTRDVQREPEQSEQQQQARERAELERVGRVQGREQDHQ